MGEIDSYIRVARLHQYIKNGFVFLPISSISPAVLLLPQQEKGDTKYTDGYSFEFVSTGMVVMASVTIVNYILYAVSPEVFTKHNSQNLYLTSFWVILGILRFMQITFVHEKTWSPTHVLLKDLYLQAIIIFWLFTFFILFYIGGH